MKIAKSEDQNAFQWYGFDGETADISINQDIKYNELDNDTPGIFKIGYSKFKAYFLERLHFERTWGSEMSKKPCGYL